MSFNLRRSLIFVPGSRPDRFSKARASGADMMCIDLEDAVAPEHKSSARQAALDYYREATHGTEQVLRINTAGSAAGADDLAALIEADYWPQFIMLPKVETAAEIREVASTLSAADKSAGLIALVESPRGLLNAVDIAEAHPSVQALMFGGADFAAEIGATMDWDALLYARGALVVAAKAAGVQLIDVPYLSIEDEQLLALETAKVLAMGFDCKSAIHPSQIPIIHRQFSPREESILHAKQIIEAYEGADGGVVMVAGAMVDRPVVIAARRILAMADMAPTQ